MNHFWIQLHTEPPVPLSEAVGDLRGWASGDVELSWNDVRGATSWTLYTLSVGTRPLSRRELRGPRHRRTRRWLRRTGFRQAWA